MVSNRFNFQPAPQGSSDFDEFAERLDDLVTHYSGLLTIGELIATLTVTQHSLIAQSLNYLESDEDQPPSNDDE